MTELPHLKVCLFPLSGINTSLNATLLQRGITVEDRKLPPEILKTFKTGATLKEQNLLSEGECFHLSFSSLQTNTNTCANSVDPDETARNEPSHQDLHCLQFCFSSSSSSSFFLLKNSI